MYKANVYRLEKMVQTGAGRVKENFKAIKRKRPSWKLNLEKKGISHNYCKDMISFFPSLNCAGEKLALDYYYTAMNFM